MSPAALFVILAAAIVATFTIIAPPPAQAARDPPVRAAARDCCDFPTQAAAQSYFISRGGPDSDPDRLDGESDGTGCESNPCPCSRSTGGGGGPSPPPKKKRRKRAELIRAVITEVVDGDTIKVRATGGKRRLLLRSYLPGSPRSNSGHGCTACPRSPGRPGGLDGHASWSDDRASRRWREATRIRI